MNLKALLVSCVLAVGTAMMTSPQAITATSAQDDVSQRRRGFFAAHAAKDPAQTSAFFIENAVLQTAGMPPIRGREAIGQFYAKLFSFIVSSEAISETLQVSSAGDMAYDLGQAKNSFKGSQGTIDYAGKYLIVWIKQQGVWRIAAYSVSADSAGP